MRKTLRSKGLGPNDFFSYGGVALAAAFIFAISFGIIDGPGSPRDPAPASPTLLAESSP